MANFIDEVVQALYGEYGAGISDLKILFPSRRARLFFRESLSEQLAEDGVPVWAPAFVSMDEVMEQVSGVQVGDHLRLLVELYKVYSRYHTESFDQFYHWGEMLLADFDAIDNYLIDAQRLFVNIDDLKQIEHQFDFLTQEQQAVVVRFWSVFRGGSWSKEQQDFLTIWNTLRLIYSEFRVSLQALGFGYKGLVYRLAAERLNAVTKGASLSSEQLQRSAPAAAHHPGTSQSDCLDNLLETAHYAVVGFNALSSSERVLFAYLRDRCHCRFFWDYDTYYTENKMQEAGLFIRQNLREFPDTLSEAPRDYFLRPKELVTVDAPSDALQCRYVADFLREVSQDGERSLGRETAIVLTNENLLIPVLYSIPDIVKAFNVTSGYDLRLTPAFSLVEYLTALQRNKRQREGVTAFYHKDVEGVLNHPYICKLLDSAGLGGWSGRIIAEIYSKEMVYVNQSLLVEHDFTRRIFSDVSGPEALSHYLVTLLTLAGNDSGSDYNAKQKREYLFLIIDSIGRLNTVIESCGINFSESIFLLSLRKVLQSQKVVFEGEPLIGVQVMGILETRNLDFDNVLILSVNEANFPGNLYSSSFVPANLRFAYGLPTVQYHEAMYAYYFYRLLQRASRVHIVYSSKDTEMDTGEPSRFVHQLRYESPHGVEHRSIALNVGVDAHPAIVVPKMGETWQRLERYFDSNRYLSPSALNQYVECPLKFYFRYIAGAQVQEELEEGVDARKFGTVFHLAMERLYQKVLNQTDGTALLGQFARQEELLDQLVEQCVSESLKLTSDAFSGSIQLMASTVKMYLKRVLVFDSAHLQGTVQGLEHEIRAVVPLTVEGVARTVTLGGTIDRVDSLANGLIRIIDYKTGSSKISGADSLALADIQQLFDRPFGKLNGVATQVLTYCYLYQTVHGGDLIPTLYFIRSMNEEAYTGLLSVGKTPLYRFSDYAKAFESHLRQTLAELFDPAIPFVQTEHAKTCEYCPFVQLCNR